MNSPEEVTNDHGEGAGACVDASPELPPCASDDNARNGNQHHLHGGTLVEEVGSGVGGYKTSINLEVCELKLGVHPDDLVQNDDFLRDAFTAAQLVHCDPTHGPTIATGGSGFSSFRATAVSALAARAGTPAIAAMMPGCTSVTITNMTFKCDFNGAEGLEGYTDDVAPPRPRVCEQVAHLVASAGAAEMVQGGNWGVTMSAGGADDTKPDEIYCVGAFGDRIVSEHKGLLWPKDVHVPLCVVADTDVTLDMSAEPQPCAVRWLGKGINARVSATAAATGGSRPPEVSCYVPPAQCCGVLSVQKQEMSGQCMGSEFRHILVLPDGIKEHPVISCEINRLQRTVAARENWGTNQENEEGDHRAASATAGFMRRSESRKLNRIVTADLAWLLCSHETGVVYENEIVIARALKIATGLQTVFNCKSQCPVLEQLLEDIRLDLLEYILSVYEDIVDKPLLASDNLDEGSHEGEDDFKKSAVSWTWWNGFNLSFLETKFKYQNFIITDSMLLMLRCWLAVGLILFHFKSQHDMPPIVVHDLTISLLVFLTILGCTQLIQWRFGMRLFCVYPYDGLFWAWLMHGICLHDTLTFFTNIKLFYVLSCFHAASTFVYRLSPFLSFTQFVGAIIVSSLKLIAYMDRWPIAELTAISRPEQPVQKLTVFALVIIPFIQYCVFGTMAAYVEIWHRRTFLATQKFAAGASKVD